MINVPDIFASMVFDKKTMQKRLPPDAFTAINKTISEGTPLDINVAKVVACAMKDWAIEHGVTHYTHWFQPMTGITAEKHDSFINPTNDGRAIMEFSGKELIKGEPDASSFPSGGIRATFEARGYTAWDPTSYAFIKDSTLCIPTTFYSYTGEVLDKKTPLLRSMRLIEKAALRLLKLFGNDDITHVTTTVGAEQEYFLIDKSVFDKRKDLKYCGRTLFGARSPKGQELEDHYSGAIRPRVAAYMKDLDAQLWKLGILAKTKHNEVAPAQHELAPIFTTTNCATDHNQLTMEIMKKVAQQHNLVCLLHEKPFAGVNGSGKHNNWSISTNTGVNLLSPGKTPQNNLQFLLFLSAVIKAVDDYQDLLRVSVATAGNDHRLGANEAPPAIISIFLGDEMTEILEAIENGEEYKPKSNLFMNVGVEAIPSVKKDMTDRNRTSPFAFTGNKFEFRMLGSSLSIACPNMIINTIVADALHQFADRLEGAKDISAAVKELIKQNYREHKRIVFNGNNYSDEWVEEAKRRGLLNLKTTAETLPHYISKKNIDLFEKYKILTAVEMHSRYEILLENYCKVLNIEALTMIDMAKKDIIPAVALYIGELADVAQKVKAINGNLACTAQEELVKKLSNLLSSFYENTQTLELALTGTKTYSDVAELAMYYKDKVFSAMHELRAVGDEIEMNTSSSHWPYPSYGDIMFSV